MCLCAGILGICLRYACTWLYVHLSVGKHTVQEKWAKEAGGSEGTGSEEGNLWMGLKNEGWQILPHTALNKASSLNLWSWRDKCSWSSTLVRLSVVLEPCSYFTSKKYGVKSHVNMKLHFQTVFSNRLVYSDNVWWKLCVLHVRQIRTYTYWVVNQ